MSNEDHDNDTCPNYATATRWMSAYGYCVTENKRLSAENADLKDRLDKAENQVEDLELKVGSLRRTVNEGSESYDNLLAENARLKAEVDGLKANNARLNVEIQRLSDAQSDALANFWSMHEAYFKLKADLERLTKLPKMDPDNYGGKFGVRDNY